MIRLELIKKEDLYKIVEWNRNKSANVYCNGLDLYMSIH